MEHLKILYKKEYDPSEDPNPMDFVNFCRDKYVVYKHLSGQVKQPRTAILTKENLKKLCGAYNEVVVKPRYGTKGEGISIIRNEDDILFENDYIVQQKIEAASLNGRIFDVRVLLQRDTITAIYSRVAARNQLVANLSQGGRAESTLKILAVVFPKTKEEIIARIQESTNDIITSLNHFDWKECALDFLLDEKGEVYFLEINSRAGITGFFILTDPDDSRYDDLVITYDDQDKKKARKILRQLMKTRLGFRIKAQMGKERI